MTRMRAGMVNVACNQEASEGVVRHKEASTRGPSKGWTGASITQMGPSKKGGGDSVHWTLADGT